MNKNSTYKVFLSIPIQGKRYNELIYKNISDLVNRLDMEVLNSQHVLHPPNDDEVLNLNAKYIYNEDLSLLKKSDILIAEKLGIPIICMYHSKCVKKVALMILGSPYINRIVIDYDSMYDLNQRLSEGLKKMLNNNTSIINHFKIKAGNYDNAVVWRKDKNILSWFKETLKSCQFCLDLGTGTGLVGAELVKNNTTVTGIDLSPEMLNKAKDRLDIVLKGKAEVLPFIDEYFDGISIRQVLHYTDESKCINEAHRVLKKEGLLACAQISTNNNETFDWWNNLKKIVQPLRNKFHKQSHLENLFKSRGFKILEVKNYTIRRKDKWDVFIINSNLEDARSKVESYFKNTPQKLIDKINLEYNNETISYDQAWSLITCKKQ